MADAPKIPLTWPSGAWKMLKKLVRAWYTAEERGNEVTQRTIAQIAGVQPSRLSMNKPFLQSIGILETEGIHLTKEGRQLGLGLTHDNERVAKEALQGIVKANPILRQLLDVIRGRGPTDREEFEAQVVMITRQGRNSDYFGTGVGVLEDMLLESGLVAMVDNTLRPTREVTRADENHKTPAAYEERVVGKADAISMSGLRRIPIPVSASDIWYVEVSESPDEFMLEKFIDMQKLIFGKKD
jgi:hypothetical protein